MPQSWVCFWSRLRRDQTTTQNNSHEDAAHADALERSRRDTGPPAQAYSLTASSRAPKLLPEDTGTTDHPPGNDHVLPGTHQVRTSLASRPANLFGIPSQRAFGRRASQQASPHGSGSTTTPAILKPANTSSSRVSPQSTPPMPQTSSMKPYTYTLLGTGQIRLLEILPATGSSTILRVKIHHVLLSHAIQHIKFTAISYVWGAVKDTRTVNVVDLGPSGTQTQLHITANLHHALCQAQTLGAQVWADGICINQDAKTEDSLREKAEQVKMMGQIYKGAHMMMVDLGPEDEYTTTAVKMVKAMKYATDMMVAEGRSKPLLDPNEFSRYGLPRPSDCQWAAWVKMLARPWFRRMWIIQEFIMAKQGSMFLGKSLLTRDLDTLAQLINISEALGFGETNRRPGPGCNDDERVAAKNTSETFGRIYDWRQLMHEDHEPINLLTAIPFTARYQMSDPVDRYYALLGLCGEDQSSDPRIAVSYSEAEADVHRRFTRFMIEESGRDAVAVIARCGGQRADFSSWCPNWSFGTGNLLPLPFGVSLTHEDNPVTGRYCSQHEYKYHAGGRSTPEITFDGSGERMILQGSQVDEVDTPIGTPFSAAWRLEAEPTRNRLFKDWYTQTHEALLRYFDKSMLSRTPFATRHRCIAEYKDAFARALVGATREQYHSPIVSAANGFAFAVLKDTEDGGTYFSPSPRILNLADYDSLAEYLSDLKQWGERLDQFRAVAPVLMCGRQVYITREGRVALLFPEARKGDKIVVIKGFPTPIVLRKELAYHRIVGEAYVEDLMSGEAVSRSGDLDQAETFYVE